MYSIFNSMYHIKCSFHILISKGWSFASLLGGMLCDGLGAVSLTWDDAPAITELEMVVVNWLAHLMDLPVDFHFFGKGNFSGAGGGQIQSSTTESLFTVAAAAKNAMYAKLVYLADKFSRRRPTMNEATGKFVAYCSEQAHPSMDRICSVLGVKLRRLWVDSKGILHAKTLKFNLQG